MAVELHTGSRTWSSKIRPKVTISTFGSVLTITNRENKRVKLRFHVPDLIVIQDMENMICLDDAEKSKILYSDRLVSMQVNDYLTFLSTLTDSNRYMIMRVGRYVPILVIKTRSESTGDVCWEFWQTPIRESNDLQLCLTMSKEELHKLCNYATAYWRDYV